MKTIIERPPTKEEEIKQVGREKIHLNNSIETLYEVLDHLEDRLSDVLIQSVPKDKDKGKPDELVPLADFLREKAWVIEAAAGRIASILERLEL